MSDRQLITRRFGYDHGREVTVSLPSSQPKAVVYAGDGELIAQWGALLEGIDAPPTMIVGSHRTASEDEMVRLMEYSPVFDPEVFAAHEDFFTQDVRIWVEAEFGVAFAPKQTAVCGVSASGELSLALGLRHPEIYGVAFSMSPGGGYRPPDPMPTELPRVYLTAGTLEPFFLENATRWADALRDAGADIVMTERQGDHGDPFWSEEFPRMVQWAFGRILP